LDGGNARMAEGLRQPRLALIFAQSDNGLVSIMSGSLTLLGSGPS
jgi:hypothetical protein